MSGLRTLATMVGCLAVASTAMADTSVQARHIATNGLSDVAPCSSCHGADGMGNPAAGFPALAGLGQAYLRDQLDGFASGDRENAVMMPMAKALDHDQRAALAAYYSQMPVSTTEARMASAPIDTDERDAGAVLARHGRWDQQLPACEQCHGPGGVGVGDRFPRLAGQPAAYLSAQLHAWQNDTRPAGPMGLMGGVAKKLSDADIDAVAAYFAARAPAASSASAEGEASHDE